MSLHFAAFSYKPPLNDQHPRIPTTFCKKESTKKKFKPPFAATFLFSEAREPERFRQPQKESRENDENGDRVCVFGCVFLLCVCVFLVLNLRTFD